MIENISLSKLERNKELNAFFSTITLDDVNQSCTYLKGNFYLDTFNYYPITEDYKSFDELFTRLNKNSIAHYHSKDFYNNLNNKCNNLKVFSDCCVVGSNPGDNYFSNLIHFLPRIFFENEKQIKIAVHRSLSKKFRTFIEFLLNFKDIKVTFKYLDDDFYKFKNSKVPQFLNTMSSLNLLKSIKDIIPKKKPEFEKIYIRREDANYRTILNEAELIEKLKKNGFKVINTSQYQILEQISFFVNAKIVLSTYGSGLANMIFCNPGTIIYEIAPEFLNKNDKYLSNRYENLSKLCNLKYYRFTADSVDVEKHTDSIKKYINEKMLNESNYYKNIILKLSELDEIIRVIQQPTDE